MDLPAESYTVFKLFLPRFHERRVVLFRNLHAAVSQLFSQRSDPNGFFQATTLTQRDLLTFIHAGHEILIFLYLKDAGAVGYDGIWIIPNELTLGSAFANQHRFGNDHVPFGRYDLVPEEASKIAVHAKLFEGIHSTLEMASQRLVDSARRTKPRGTIVDAVIGLETILLANTGDRTELRFRFSLHYALLFAKVDRNGAFLTARDLYDLRSKIAHGSKAKSEITINAKKLTLGDAANLARSVLRKVIDTFIKNSASPDFMTPDFWMSKELGVD